MSQVPPTLITQMRRLGLLNAEQTTEASSIEGDSAQLCRELLRRGWLTAMQVNRLITGQGETLSVGGCLLLDRLGEGGMGTVYRAQHKRLGRPVALKLIHKGRMNPEAIRRFLREVRVTSTLDHPNVVRALDAGEDGGTHFLVLELLEGTNLAQLVSQGGTLSVALACEYCRQAALGLQHAHERGLVHRDVKPSNLMLSGSTIKLLDLGLSTGGELGDEAHSLTDTGDVMGTVDYMAPEQTLDAKAADARSDVYSLGCTLYHLLVGHAPFLGKTLGAKFLQHQTQEAPSLESLRPDVPSAVSAIVAKMMAKKPEQRYQSAAEVAAVLGDVLIAANWSPASTFGGITGDATAVADSFWRERLRGHLSPGRLLLAGALTLCLLLALGVLFWSLSRPRPVVLEGEPAYALDRLSANNIAADERFSWQPRELVQVLGEHRGRHWDRVTGLAFSADGKLLHSAGRDGSVRTWHTDTLREADFARAGRPLISLGATRDRTNLFCVSDDRKLIRISAQDLQVRQRYETPSVREAISPDGKFAVFGDNTAALLELETGTSRTIPGIELRTNWVFSGDGKLLAAIAQQKEIVVYDVTTLREVKRLPALPPENRRLYALAFSADSRTLVSGDNYSIVRLHDVYAEAEPRWTETASLGLIQTLALTHGSDRVVASSINNASVSDGRGKFALFAESSDREFSALTLSPDGSRAALGENEGRVRIHDLAMRKQLVLTEGLQGRVNALTVTPDGSRAITVGHAERGGRAILWDIETGKALALLDEPHGRIRSVALSADGKGFYYGTTGPRGKGGEVCYVELADGKAGPRHRVGYKSISALMALPDGRLAVAAFDEVLIFNPVTAKVETKLSDRERPVTHLAIGGQSDATRLVVGGSGSEKETCWVDIYDPDQRRLGSLSPHKFRNLRDLAVSSDGRWLASTAGDDGAVRLSDLTELKTHDKPLAEYPQEGQAVYFFPNGKWVVASGSYGELEVRKLDGELVRKLGPLPGQVSRLVVDRTGNYLVMGNGNGTAYVLRLK